MCTGYGKSIGGLNASSWIVTSATVHAMVNPEHTQQSIPGSPRTHLLLPNLPTTTSSPPQLLPHYYSIAGLDIGFESRF